MKIESFARLRYDATCRGRAATQSGPPSPRTDPDVRREAYRTGLFRHATDVASASPAAIAFREVGAARSVRLTLSGQSLRRAWFPVQAAYAGQSLVTSGARRTVSMTERPREAPALSLHHSRRATRTVPHRPLQARLRRHLRITCGYRLP